MAQYIGYVQGNRGQVSRTGSKNSGVKASAQGWDIGARVVVFWNEEKECDEVTVLLTCGSSFSGDTRDLGTFKIGKNGKFAKC